MIDGIIDFISKVTPMEIVTWVFCSILAITLVIMAYGDLKSIVHEILFRAWLKKNRNYTRFTTKKEALEMFEREDSVNEYAKLTKNMRRR